MSGDSIALAAATEARDAVLAEVAAERQRQEAKWGQQNHPNGTGPDLVFKGLPVDQADVRADHMAAWAKDRCWNSAADGGDTWERILTEEWGEAITESESARLRAELVQVAAVAVAWVEAIDRADAIEAP